jgi:hypothetical protein
MPDYFLCWTSVDGAGRLDAPYPSLGLARSGADRAQLAANRTVNVNGQLARNPWGYRYFVRNERGDIVHEAWPSRALRRPEAADVPEHPTFDLA